MSPVAPIDVEPRVFDAASTVMGTTVAGQLTDALQTLSAALSGCGSMAGSDSAGTRWAGAYDPAAADAVSTAADLANASSTVAALLEQTGFNHGMAEAASDPNRTVPTPPDRTRYGTTSVTAAAPPSAAGGSDSPPSGWGLIEHLVGYAWPNGHQDRLRQAAAAWSAAAESLDFASDSVPEAIQAVASQSSPEVSDAVSVLTSLSQHIEDVAGVCRSLSDACSQYAGFLDTAHHDVEHELISLLEWTAGIEVGGGLLAVVSFGASGAAAQAAEAARIAATASRVAAIIVRLIDLAGGVADTIANVVTRVGEVAQRLRVILGARLSEAGTSLVARLPALSDDTGAISFSRLSAWEKGWSARGLDIEEHLGGNLPRSFPTIDKLDNGIVTSIKSVDLTGITYQNPATLTARLHDYVDTVSAFDGARFDGVRIPSDMIRGRALEIAIQPGVATPAQQAVLDELAIYGRAKGVQVIITEVP
jgi:hypothetical protein